MPTVALVTGTFAPDGVDPQRMRDLDQPLVDALTLRGVEVSQPSWRETLDWSAFDLVVVRTAWDYVEDRDDFVAWAATVGEVTRCWNPPDVLRWNTHKSYLLELEERGVPIVPTAWIAQGDDIDLAALLDARGWKRAIIKPAVGAGARGLVRVDIAHEQAQAHLDQLVAGGDALVQPYLAEVETVGELSVIVVDGRVSHAVRKVPGRGEFRVQQEFGSSTSQAAISRDAVALAEWVVEVTGHDLLFARVDLLEEAGSLFVMELELTEPELFLVEVAEAAQPLADAVVGRLS